MRIKTNLYAKAKDYSVYVTEITTELETVTSMMNIGQADEEKINKNYEKRRRQDVKNALANIYLLLDLHEVDGVADEIFNSEFVKK